MLPSSLISKIPAGKGLVIFDGYCSLCSRSVRFLLLIDKRKGLLFAAGNDLFDWDNSEKDTIVYCYEGRTYERSGAIIEALKQVGGFWKFLGRTLQILPANFRDRIYRWVAGNRSHWFGRHETCYLPDTKHTDRFI